MKQPFFETVRILVDLFEFSDKRLLTVVGQAPCAIPNRLSAMFYLARKASQGIPRSYTDHRSDFFPVSSLPRESDC